MYLLFAGYTYYPDGGWGDFHGKYETEADAVEGANKALDDGCDWWHVVDMATMKITKNGKR